MILSGALILLLTDTSLVVALLLHILCGSFPCKTLAGTGISGTGTTLASSGALTAVKASAGPCIIAAKTSAALTIVSGTGGSAVSGKSTLWSVASALVLTGLSGTAIPGESALPLS